MKFWPNVIIGLTCLVFGMALFVHAFLSLHGWDLTIALGSAFGWWVGARACFEDAHEAHVEDVAKLRS